MSEQLQTDIQFEWLHQEITPELFVETMRSGHFVPLAEYIDTHDTKLEMCDGTEYGICRVTVNRIRLVLVLSYYVEYAGGPEEQVPDLYMDIFTRDESDAWNYEVSWSESKLFRRIQFATDDWLNNLQKEMIHAAKEWIVWDEFITCENLTD